MTLDGLLDRLASARPVYIVAAALPADLVAEAVALGLVEIWEDSPAGRPAAVLTELARKRLGLELDHGRGGATMEGSRWVPTRRRRPAAGGEPAEDIPEVAAAEPEPLEALVAREEQEAEQETPPARSPRRAARRELPRPTTIVGSTYPGWSPDLEQAGVDPCRVCRGRLRPAEHCLACSRSGDDAPILAAPARPKPKASVAGDAPEDRSHRGTDSPAARGSSEEARPGGRSRVCSRCPRCEVAAGGCCRPRLLGDAPIEERPSAPAPPARRRRPALARA